MSAIKAAKAWAPVSPAGKRGTRWILYQFASGTKRECRVKMGLDYPRGAPASTWDFWRKRGWTIERVKIEAAT